MTVRDRNIIEMLAKEDDDFKRLVEQHRELDKKIQELDAKIYLLPDEEVERKKLSKIKLSKKDKIAKIVSDYKKTTS